MHGTRMRGASLVDVLVGLAIALVSIVVVYQAFVALDAVRRNTADAADAQGGGAFALFALASQIGNAGAGFAAAAHWLDTCAHDADVAASLRPVAVLITDGGAADRSDTLVVRQALAPVTAMPVAFATAASAGADFHVESPDGFAVGDRVVAISRAGSCTTADLTSVSVPSAGIVQLGHTPVAIDLPASTVLLNLGPAGASAITRYDVVARALRSADLGNGDAPVPIASNVVNVKFQYGIDSDGDGALDTWSGAATSGTWAPATLLAAPHAVLARIKAIRVGIIVRSERPDRELLRDHHWVLFDCELDDKAACPGRLEGTIAGASSGSYRYRSFEAVVPLRNALWNRAP